MNSLAIPATGAGDDLSALAWVHGELRRSLENAHKGLRRHLKEAEAIGGSDVDIVDPSVLRNARAQIHQGVGALELVGLPTVAQVLRASEAAMQRLVARPALLDAAAVDTIERASFAVLDFLARQLAGKPVSPVMLFPQYRAAQQMAAADRVHPADLWPLDFQWHELAPEPGVAARASDDLARGQMEALVLGLMRRTDAAALHQLSEFSAELAAGAPGAPRSREATLWRLASAVFEAEGRGQLANDVYTKRLASRLLAQLRLAARGQHEVTDRLALDLLFFCAHAGDAQAGMPRLAAVRRAWRLDRHPSADYETARLGRFDPALIALARKRVAGAKDAWSAVAGGELHRIGALNEHFALVGESLAKLFPAGEALTRSLNEAAARTVGAGEAPAPALAMEVATAMLYVDATIEDGDLDHPELGERMRRLARRIDEVRGGAAVQPLEPWMEELYRRVSDRQTMGSVVQELRATLSEVEKQIDQYFRNPAERQVLIPVPAQLGAMRGVLSVLGLDQASQAVLHMRDDIDALAQTEVDPERAIQTGTFDRVADNLGALSFLIDMLSVQPALAKSLFRFDAASGSLSAVMGQVERTSAFAPLDVQAAAAAAAAAVEPERSGADQARELVELAARADVPDADVERALERLAQRAFASEQGALARAAGSALSALRSAADAAQRQAARAQLAPAFASFLPAPALAPPAVAPPPVRATPVAAPGGTGLEDDPEMREVFIEEAREVVTEARAALERLADAPESTTEMTAVRRAFHTLKGSSRMVGLRDFGEAAWACEQLYNARLAAAPRLDAPLRLFTTEALAYFAPWVEAIAAGRDDGHRSAAVARAAEALRLEGVRLPIEAAVAPGPAPAPAVPAAAAEPAPGLPVMPAAAPAGLELPLPAAAETVEAAAAAEAAPVSLAAEPAGTDDETIPAGVTAAGAADLALDLPDLPAPPAEPPLGLGEATGPLRPEAWPSDGAPAPAPEALDFELELPESAPPAEPLTARVPDLPSAADLDLAPVPVPEVAFTLDLGALEDEARAVQEAVPGPPPPAAVAPPEAIDLPLDIEPAPSLPVADALPVEADLRAFELPPVDDAATEPPAPPALPVAEAIVPESSVVEPVIADPLTEATIAIEAIEGLDAIETIETIEAVEPTFRPFGAEPPPAPSDAELVDQPLPAVEEEQVKVIGPLRISIPLFNIFLNEADELSRRLATELAEWGFDPLHHPVPEGSIAHAHSLAGNSATVGYAELSALARALEHALERARAVGVGRPGEAELFGDAADEIRRLLHQFAAGFLRPVPDELMRRLADHERWPAEAVIEAAPEVPAAEPPDEAPAAMSALRRVAVSDFAPLEPVPDAATGGHGPVADAADDEIDAVDAIDAELFPIFEEEAHELLPQLQSRLRDWHDRPGDRDAAAACMRTLHTFKGGARLAGAMRLGEMAHRLETAIEHLATHDEIGVEHIDPLLVRSDAMAMAFEALRRGAHGQPAAPAAAEAVAWPAIGPAAPAAPAPTAPEVALDGALSSEPAVAWAAEPTTEPTTEQPTEPTGEPTPEPTGEPTPEPTGEPTPEPIADSTAQPLVEPAAVPFPALEAAPAPDETPPAGVEATQALEPPAERPPATPEPAPAPRIDWQRFSRELALEPEHGSRRAGAAAGAMVRVRAGLLDRLVNAAGEVSITRERIAADTKQLQSALTELTDSLERMRRQLRDIELQAETQIASRMELARAAGQGFDPLEMDRFTRFQELTRFMAESVNDVATLQRSLQRTLQSTEDELAAQARLTRDLQDDLLRTRMVEFESLAERLYRTVRQAAKETGKQVRLDLVGGAIEIDRGVLERMVGSFEHLLRNSVAHGIEPAAQRTAAGKEPQGRIQVQISQAGNEVAVEFGDDGGGFDYERIRRRGIERGLLAPDTQAGEAELAQLLFQPGFSTAEGVTELAGRGVGLDVVRAEVNAMGGRIETASAPGQGTRFRLLLPLTTAVTQVVMLRCGALQVAVPSTVIEIVRRVPAAEVERAYASGAIEHAGEIVPFFWLASLLESGARGNAGPRASLVVVVRSAAQRVAVHIDEVVGTQEVVVKHVGPQLARLPGLAGVTLLPSGAVALIYNPVALATLYAEQARERMRRAAPAAAAASAEPAAPAPLRAPLVLVVDDSLTVRRVTQRLLVREGYRVVTAKDGLEALERLAEERPAVLLSDIEMPRMDGFDLLRNVRADAALAGLPVVMITSRTAQKHRDYAAELGADHYLGKPYAEEELLALVARHAGADIVA